MRDITNIPVSDVKKMTGRHIHVVGCVELRNFCAGGNSTESISFDTIITELDTKYSIFCIAFWDEDECNFNHADNPYPERFDAERRYCCSFGDIEPHWVQPPVIWLIEE